MTLHQSAIDVLGAWRPEDPAQDSLRHAVLAFLDTRADACLRECVPGHITASALVLDHDGTHALLTLHPRVGRWLQLGGHCEPSDDTLVAAALREATEESGIDGLTIAPTPAALHVHPVTCSLGVPTRHLDVQFVRFDQLKRLGRRSDTAGAAKIPDQWVFLKDMGQPAAADVL